MKNFRRAVRVFAPATVANVAVGFDILGFALDSPGDEIIARWGNSPGLRITKISGVGKKTLPTSLLKNTAGYGSKLLLEHLGEEKAPIELEIFKKMPFGSGMGSSAASAAAGVFAVNELLGRPMAKDGLVRFAVMGESAADGAIHGDNVIPSLLGGMVLIRNNSTFEYIKLPFPRGLCVLLIYPEIEILTREARAVLSKHVSLEQHIQQSGNLASFVASLYTQNIDLMRNSLEDQIIEPQRASLIPFFYEMKAIAMAEGCINYTISGAGPTMFGFCENTLVAENAAEKIIKFLGEKGISGKSFFSHVNTCGTRVL